MSDDKIKLTIDQVLIKQDDFSALLERVDESVAHGSLEIKLVLDGTAVEEVLHDEQVGAESGVGCGAPVDDAKHTDDLA